MIVDEGLSPRVRGSPGPGLRGRAIAGIIPACAGKPCRWWPASPEVEDYPRVCGEASCTRTGRTSRRGLSPRVRGSRRRSRLLRLCVRIIPACAGKPRRPRCRCPSAGDYPRVCGEAHVLDVVAGVCQGLSPRVRGSLCTTPAAPVFVGIIPACAGKPRRHRVPQGRHRDYPRVCGEAGLKSDTHGCILGLSPRVRGSQGTLPAYHSRPGIIPACAGKPVHHAGRAGVRGDYPRVCGEAASFLTISLPLRGLSPRVRGSLGQQLQSARHGGIIPACAGKPDVGGHAVRHLRDYPRVCGEATEALTPRLMSLGLSPRVRGSP